MSCSRCNGCMVEDFLLDMEDSSGPMWLQAWRCMNCGNVTDSVLRRNRQTQVACAISDAAGKREATPLGIKTTAKLAA